MQETPDTVLLIVAPHWANWGQMGHDVAENDLLCENGCADLLSIAQLATLATLIRIHYLVKPLHTDAVFIV